MFLLVSLGSSIIYIPLIVCCAFSPNTLHGYKVLTLQKYCSVNPEKGHVEMGGSQTVGSNKDYLVEKE